MPTQAYFMTRRLATALTALGLCWASGSTIYLLAGQGRRGIRTSFTVASTVGDATPVVVSLVSANGVWIVGLLGGITLLAGLPLGVALSSPARQRATSYCAGLLLFVFSLMTAFTVGLFYLPCAVVLLVAAVVGAVDTPSRRDPHHGMA